MFRVIEVPPAAANLPEQLGTKEKFWYQENEDLYLFKEARAGTGEDWSEKIASELCRLLDLPHANYELGLWKGRRGVVSQTFVPRGGRLIHGNELLAKLVPEYPKQKFFRVRQHTIGLVLGFMMSPNIRPPIGFEPLENVKTLIDVFIGYLMLDAWIANQDRHHENWGLVLTEDGIVHLAPSYDHASSLGRNESDEVRQERLTTRDTNRGMEHYVTRAKSAFYPSLRGSTSPLTTLEAFLIAAKTSRQAALFWLNKLRNVSLDETYALFREIGNERISHVAIDFAQRMLQLNKNRLLNCVEALSR